MSLVFDVNAKDNGRAVVIETSTFYQGQWRCCYGRDQSQNVSLRVGTKMVMAINSTEKEFRTAFPQVLWLFFEPDITDS